MNTAEALKALVADLRVYTKPITEDGQTIEEVFACVLKQADSALSASAEQQPKAIEFIDHLINGVFEGADWDGGSLQNLAVQYGLLKNVEMQAPCSDEGCQCAQMEADFPAICYRKTYLNTSAPQASQPVAYADPQAFKNFGAGTCDKEWMWAKPDAGLVPLYLGNQSQPVALTDERTIVDLAIKHRLRYPTNRALLAFVQALLSATSQPSESEIHRKALEGIKAIPTVVWWHKDGHPAYNNANGEDLILRESALAAIRALRQQAPAVQDERAEFEASVIARKSSEIGRALSEKEVAYVLKRYVSWNCHLTKEAPYESPCLEAEWKGWEARAASHPAPAQTGEKK